MNYHVAIMNPKLGFINKILKGEKVIETRWYKNRIAPWDKISPGDVIYFKNSGKFLTAKAVVAKVEQFQNLNENKIKDLIDKNFSDIGLTKEIKDQFTAKHLNKNYVIFIWLENPEEIEPTHIDKTGFGNAAAWLTMDKIKSLSL